MADIDSLKEEYRSNLTQCMQRVKTELDNKANLTDLDKYIPLPTTQTVILYVDNINGNDDNDGLTEDKPIKTITRNMKPQLTPVANYMYFYMLSDYTGTISVPQCKSVSMVSKNVNNPITINGHIFANSIHNFSMQYINVKATANDTQYGIWLDVTNGSIYKCKSEGFDVGAYCNNGFVSFKEFTTTNCTTSIEGMGFCLADVAKSTFNSGDIGIKLTDGSYFTVDAITRDNNKATVFTQNDNGVLFIDKILQNDVLNGEGGASTADAVEYVNDAISVTNVEEALNKLIADFYYVAPSITSFTASPTGGTFEIGTTITAPITFNWNYNKDITTQTLTDCTLADETVRTVTYNTDITTNKTFTLSANDGKNNVSKSISYKFVYPYYVGVLNTNTPTESDIVGLTKKVEAKGNKTLEFTTSQSYMAFAYPSSYGDISKIVDQNGFDVTASFTKSTIVINSVDYYVYISNKNSGSYSMTINY